MTTYLRIQGRDPLVARDGRPFGEGQGNRMRSAGWLYPSVVAGSFRTVLGKVAQRAFDTTTQTELLNLSVAGVLPVADRQLYLPAPHDCVLGENAVFQARPQTLQNGEGGDWPVEGLRPVLIDAAEDFKPVTGPAFWPLSEYARWLSGERINPRQDTFLAAPLEDLRDHVSLDAEYGFAAEGLLFTTTGIGSFALPRYGAKLDEPHPSGKRRYDDFAEVELAARVDGAIPAWATGPMSKLSIWHPLGGERRLAQWSTANDAGLWKCPDAVAKKLASSKQVALTMVTPAIFSDGWKPGWLDRKLTGRPFDGAPRLTLVGVCIQRWRAVSGWSYRDGGPKAIRRMVPAGGVYFFESETTDNQALTQGWLHSVSDGDQDRRDGFGLAAWGIW